MLCDQCEHAPATVALEAIVPPRGAEIALDPPQLYCRGCWEKVLAGNFRLVTSRVDEVRYALAGAEGR